MRRALPGAAARTILALTMLALLVAGCDRGQSPPVPGVAGSSAVLPSSSSVKAESPVPLVV